MKNKKKENIEQLISYLCETGFSQSMEEIANGLGVAKKTLFNRYGSRAELKKQVSAFWRQKTTQKLSEKTLLLNNPIEKILFFAYELLFLSTNETVFYWKEKEEKNFILIDDEHSFRSLLQQILDEAEEEGCFFAINNTNEYAKIFLHYLVYLNISYASLNIPSLCTFINPLLTQKGEEMLNCINLESLFRVKFS